MAWSDAARAASAATRRAHAHTPHNNSAKSVRKFQRKQALVIHSATRTAHKLHLSPNRRRLFVSTAYNAFRNSRGLG